MFFYFFFAWGSGFIVLWVSGLIEMSLYSDDAFLEHLVWIYVLEFALVDIVVDFAFGFLGWGVKDLLGLLLGEGVGF